MLNKWRPGIWEFSFCLVAGYSKALYLTQQLNFSLLNLRKSVGWTVWYSDCIDSLRLWYHQGPLKTAYLSFKWHLRTSLLEICSKCADIPLSPYILQHFPEQLIFSHKNQLIAAKSCTHGFVWWASDCWWKGNHNFSLSFWKFKPSSC